MLKAILIDIATQVISGLIVAIILEVAKQIKKHEETA